MDAKRGVSRALTVTSRGSKNRPTVKGRAIVPDPVDRARQANGLVQPFTDSIGHKIDKSNSVAPRVAKATAA